MNLQDFFKAFTCTVRPRNYVDTIDNPVQMGIEGKVTFQRFDKYGKLVSEQIKKNTVSDWVARNREAEIRALARQGTSIMRDWFKSIVLCNTPLDILPNSNNINLYNLDTAGTYIKTLDKHPLVTGYCLNLTTNLDSGLKCGVYDTTLSNAGRKLDKTRRSISFPAGKATGIIRSVCLFCDTDPLTGAGSFQEYHTLALPTNINPLSGIGCKVIGKNTLGNYIISTGGTSLYEINPLTGTLISTKSTESTAKEFISYINGTLYKISTQDGTNGTLTIKKAPWSTRVYDTGTNIIIQKPNNTWYGCASIITDGTYLYIIHYNGTSFFIAKIDPGTLVVVEYFNYLTNLVNFNFSNFTIDPADNTLNISAYISSSTYTARYRVTPSAANKYENLYTNAQQFGFMYDSIGSIFACGIYKINNHYYTSNFQSEIIPNNFGARVNLDADEDKPDNESVTVHYEFTIL